MPVHGDTPFLEEAVLSIVRQEHEDWELLMVLDRPDSNLDAKAKALSDSDARIRSMISPGEGIVDALNFGVLNANGDLIARLDSDDMMEPSRLKKQSAIFFKDKSLGCVGTQMLLIDQSGREIGKTTYPCDSGEIGRTLEYQNCVGHPSVMYRKNFVLSVGGYRKTLSGVEDYDLWIRMSKKSKIINLRECLTRYRTSPGQYSKTFGNSYSILEDAVRVDSIFNFLPREDGSVEQLETLRLKIRQVRRQNFLMHPLKVFATLKGLLVSKLMRVASTSARKCLKFIQVVPTVVLLFMISPRTVIHLTRRRFTQWSS